MKAVALCYKPYLKPEEAMIYCDLHKTQFHRKCEDFKISKNAAGYFKKEDLDRMMSGQPSETSLQEKQFKLRFRARP